MRENISSICDRIRSNQRLTGSNSDGWKVSSPEVLTVLLSPLPLTHIDRPGHIQQISILSLLNLPSLD